MAADNAVIIGNFDGVHRGHQALVRSASTLIPGGRVVALVFRTHPAAVLRPGSQPAVLTTPIEREQRLRSAGVHDIVWLEPTPDLLQLSPDAFVGEYVLPHSPGVVAEGKDFRFGAGRAGDMDTLAALGRKHGFNVESLDPVMVALSNHAVVQCSSSMIRWLLERGRVRDAACLLGRPYSIESRVVPGARRGRSIGFPTANLAPVKTLVPADGVYAGHATLSSGARYDAAISVGTNPTFGDAHRRCEAHLLDFDGSVESYDWTIRVSFEAWLRDQIKYDAVPPLVDQIRRDTKRSRDLLRDVAS